MNEINKKPGKRLENSYLLSYNSSILSDFLKKLHHNVFSFFSLLQVPIHLVACQIFKNLIDNKRQSRLSPLTVVSSFEKMRFDDFYRCLL